MKTLILISASLALMAVSAQAGGRGDPHDDEAGGQVVSYNLNANGNWNKNSNANHNSNKNANKNSNSNRNSNKNTAYGGSAKQGQGQAQGQAQKATNTTTITSHSEGSNYVGLDTPVCGNSAGGSNSQGAFGITFDSRNCNIRAEAALLNNIGLKVAAKKQTCFMRRVRNNSAMKDFCKGYNK